MSLHLDGFPEASTEDGSITEMVPKWRSSWDTLVPNDFLPSWRDRSLEQCEEGKISTKRELWDPLR